MGLESNHIKPRQTLPRLEIKPSSVSSPPCQRSSGRQQRRRQLHCFGGDVAGLIGLHSMGFRFVYLLSPFSLRGSSVVFRARARVAFFFLCVCGCVFVCLCASVSLSLSLCMCLCVVVSLSLSLSKSLSLSLSLSLCLSLRLSLGMSAARPCQDTRKHSCISVCFRFWRDLYLEAHGSADFRPNESSRRRMRTWHRVSTIGSVCSRLQCVCMRGPVSLCRNVSPLGHGYRCEDAIFQHASAWTVVGPCSRLSRRGIVLI